jgi:excisionase family DNA binding protein
MPSTVEVTEKGFYSMKELATLSRRCYRTILRAVQERKIRSVNFGRAVMIPAEEVDRILKHGWR